MVRYIFPFTLLLCVSAYSETIVNDDISYDLRRGILSDVCNHTPYLQECAFSGITQTKLNIPPSNLADHSAISDEEWVYAAPFLMPDKHPLKKKLDKIFSKSRVTESVETLTQAGFSTKGVRLWSGIVVARHPDCKGYIFKLFTDEQTGYYDLKRLTDRIKGARLAQEVVDKYSLHAEFKIPKKWIYVLPEKPKSAYPDQAKHFVLVAEDMDIIPRAQNYAKWTRISHHKLAAVYLLITEAGLYDCVYAFNLPFSYDGRIAIIDTEQFQGWPIPYFKLTKYLNSETQEYWNSLIDSGGK